MRVFTTAKTILLEVPLLIGNGSFLDILKEKHLPSLNLLHGLHDIWGNDVVRIKRVDDLYKALTGAPSISATNLLDLYGVKYVISVTPIEGDRRFELIYSRIESLQGKKEELLRGNTIKLYRNLNPLPRAWLVKDHRVLDEKSILALLSGKEFNPRKEVLLEEEPGINPPGPPLVKGGGERGLVKGGKEKRLVKRGESGGKEVEFISERNNCLQLFVNAKEGSFLVLSDTYFPGWKAYLDGNPVKIFQANYNFRAVSVPPGKHELEFVYYPMSVKLGALVTSLGIIGILVMRLSSRFKWRFVPPVC
jgi:Bacterial membrane protein YfhO